MMTNIKMDYNDFPASYRSADSASVSSQNQFVKFTLSNIILMIIAAIVGSITISTAFGGLLIAVISAILLTIGIFFTLLLRNIKLEKNWYDGRAIAESAKTLTWRYIIGSEPYLVNLGPQADELLISNLHSLLTARPAFAAKMCNEYNMDEQITQKMRAIRGLNIEERKKFYLSERINSQREWYNKKSQNNLKSANRYFIGTLISQLLAIITAFTIIFWKEPLIQFTGIFTTIATACIAWTQVRRNEELAQSYGLASQELNFIHAQSFQIKTEEQLSAFINNAEMAISREHTMWLAKKT